MPDKKLFQTKYYFADVDGEINIYESMPDANSLKGENLTRSDIRTIERGDILVMYGNEYAVLFFEEEYGHDLWVCLYDMENGELIGQLLEALLYDVVKNNFKIIKE